MRHRENTVHHIRQMLITGTILNYLSVSLSKYSLTILTELGVLILSAPASISASACSRVSIPPEASTLILSPTVSLIGSLTLNFQLHKSNILK